MSTATVRIKNEPFVVLPRAEYQELLARSRGVTLPELPAADKNGRYPAKDSILAMIARDIITSRLAAGWSREGLAKRAKVRVETIAQLESGKHKPQAAVIAKIQAAFEKAGV